MRWLKNKDEHAFIRPDQAAEWTAEVEAITAAFQRSEVDATTAANSTVPIAGRNAPQKSDAADDLREQRQRDQGQRLAQLSVKIIAAHKLSAALFNAFARARKTLRYGSVTEYLDSLNAITETIKAETGKGVSIRPVTNTEVIEDLATTNAAVVRSANETETKKWEADRSQLSMSGPRFRPFQTVALGLEVNGNEAT